MDNVIYTIGYGNRKPETTLGILNEARIAVVVDSRRQFSKSWCHLYWWTSLKKWLEGQGFQHRYADELGNQYDTLEEYRNNQLEDIRKHEVRYLCEDICKWNDEGKRVALLCAEIDPAKCHRSILADKLVEMLGDGWKVEHL